LNPCQRRRLRWGRVERRTANGRRSSAGPAQRYIAVDRQKRLRRGHVGLGPGRPGFPHMGVSRHCPRRQLRRSRVREAQVRVILLERGLDRSPGCRRRGTGCSPANGFLPLRSLDDCSFPACSSIAFTASGSTMIYTKRPPKNLLGCLRSNVIRTY